MEKNDNKVESFVCMSQAKRKSLVLPYMIQDL